MLHGDVLDQRCCRMETGELLQTTRQLTYAAALIGVSAAVAKCREIGAPECIAIVDAAGQLLAYARVEGAAVLARDPAIAKAATAAALGTPSGTIPFEFGVNLGVASRDAIVNLGGGLPIVHEGCVVGAVGVGSGTTEQDIAVAEAGRDAVLAALADHPPLAS
ncbi:heme-binding protein [Aquabacter sp. CN5-332]|uniref:GlcG/HbpS family heme-binding protein n=1 Tax=Aquabacter sp. CN5-332 TaxID=3156608 RepID=UPI0032B4DF53